MRLRHAETAISVHCVRLYYSSSLTYSVPPNLLLMTHTRPLAFSDVSSHSARFGWGQRFLLHGFSAQLTKIYYTRHLILPFITFVAISHCKV